MQHETRNWNNLDKCESQQYLIALMKQNVLCQDINYCRVSSYGVKIVSTGKIAHSFDEKIVSTGKLSHSFDEKVVSAGKISHSFDEAVYVREIITA